MITAYILNKKFMFFQSMFNLYGVACISIVSFATNDIRWS